MREQRKCSVGCVAADHRTRTMPTDELLSLANAISLLKRSPRSYTTRRVTNPRNGQRSGTIGLVLVMLQFRSTKTVAWFSNSPRLVTHHRLFRGIVLSCHPRFNRDI